jgi:hypothetical protein
LIVFVKGLLYRPRSELLTSNHHYECRLAKQVETRARSEAKGLDNDGDCRKKRILSINLRLLALKYAENCTAGEIKELHCAIIASGDEESAIVFESWRMGNIPKSCD